MKPFHSPGIAITGHATSDWFLTQTSGSECQAFQLGPSWTSPSPASCFIACIALYSNACNGMIYNKNSQTCYPTGTPFTPIATITNSVPGSDPNDAIFYPKTIPAPQCNGSLGFAVYDVCGTSACLFISTSTATYPSAIDQCDAMNATMFVADSLQKFSLFWYVSLNFINKDTYLGLTDIQSEGDFVWVNGKPLTSDQHAYIWAPGQPDEAGFEDCVEARHGTWPDVFGLNDIPCGRDNRYICEYKE